MGRGSQLAAASTAITDPVLRRVGSGHRDHTDEPICENQLCRHKGRGQRGAADAWGARWGLLRAAVWEPASLGDECSHTGS